MKRIIVTHINPDLDAVAACWLVKRFWPEWGEAKIEFVPAGTKYKGKADEMVVHVDTGGGEYDHHQSSGEQKITSATELVFEKSVKDRIKKAIERQALARMVRVITEIDNFRELMWPEAYNDRYDFGLHEIINVWATMYKDNPQKVMALGFMALDGVLNVFKNKVRAEEVVRKQGKEFESQWGLSLAIETGNSYVEHLAQKMGYVVVIRRHPDKGFIRITARWDKGVDLSEVYEKLKIKDPQATWFLHPSKCMLLNGARSNPNMKTTRLSLEEVVETVKAS